MEKAQNFAKALKELRKSKGISLEQISDFCKIKKDYLEKIESGEFSFKSEIYVKLFLKEYIRFVDFKKSDSITNEFNKILNKNSITIEPDLSSSSKVFDNDNIDNSQSSFDAYSYSPKKIATIIFTIIIIIFTYQTIVSFFLN